MVSEDESNEAAGLPEEPVHDECVIESNRASQGSAPLTMPYPTKADVTIYQSLYYLEFLLRLQRRNPDSREIEEEIKSVLSANGPIVRACSLLHLRSASSLIHHLDLLFIDRQACYDAIALVESKVFSGTPVVCTNVTKEELLSSLYIIVNLLNDTSRAVYLEEIYYSIWGLVKQIDHNGTILNDLRTERNALVCILKELYTVVEGFWAPGTENAPAPREIEQHLIDYKLRKTIFDQLMTLYKGIHSQLRG